MSRDGPVLQWVSTVEVDPDARGSLVYEPCGHVRRRVGTGEADGIVVDAWRCDPCDDILLERR